MIDDDRQIENLLARFFQSFDEKNWTLMRSCLAERVFTDYSSFRKVAPAEITADRYVEQRRAALHALDMQHNYLNLLLDIDGDRASARCNYIIHRFHPDFDGAADGFFHSYGHYRFAFQRTMGDWKIIAITQHLLRNSGNPELHGATRKVANTRDA